MAVRVYGDGGFLIRDGMQGLPILFQKQMVSRLLNLKGNLQTLVAGNQKVRQEYY